MSGLQRDDGYGRGSACARMANIAAKRQAGRAWEKGKGAPCGQLREGRLRRRGCVGGGRCFAGVGECCWDAVVVADLIQECARTSSGFRGCVYRKEVF